MSLQRKEQQDIQVDVESVDYIIAHTPLALNALDPDIIEVGNYYLPRSTGWEMEFDNNGELLKEHFEGINLLDLDINDAEQRFRIPKGIEGLQSLYQVSMILRKHAIFSDYSGIHYHIDATDFINMVTHEKVDEHKEIILSELDSWGYDGTFNFRNMSFNRDWVRVCKGYKTIEIRIGKMLFDYPSLFKRITHCNHIVEKFRMQLVKDDLEANSPILLYEDDKDIKDVLNNRIEKI